MSSSSDQEAAESVADGINGNHHEQDVVEDELDDAKDGDLFGDGSEDG